MCSFSLQAGITKGNECKTIKTTEIINIEKLSIDQTILAPLSVSKVVVKCIGTSAKELIKITAKSIRDVKTGAIINGGFGFKAQASVLDENMNAVDQKQTNHYFFLTTTLKNGSFLQVHIDGFDQILISL